jgi:hypothetical protein
MDPNKITKRLSRDTTYKTDQQSYQSTLSENDIAKKLADYVRVRSSEITSIPINTHIRYFTINPKNGEKQFRLGGSLTKIDEDSKYLILSNGTFSWSVQLSNSIIYRKLSPNELKETIKSSAVDEVKKETAELIKENKELKKMIKEIKEATIKAKEVKKEKKHK